ncbi:hypothetical protein ACHAXR_001957 [Thalassiosira sp. AJA248-18]
MPSTRETCSTTSLPSSIRPTETDSFLGYTKKRKHTTNHDQFLNYVLKRSFKGRFTRTSPEFAVAISSGDYPHAHLSKLPHVGDVTPVLHFGSVFRDTNLYLNMIAMPMPGLYLGCFGMWALSGSASGSVCRGLRPPMFDDKEHQGELTFGDELGLEWDDLTCYLFVTSLCSNSYHTLHPYIYIAASTGVTRIRFVLFEFATPPLLSKPPFPLTEEQESEETNQQSRMMAATEALREIGATLTARHDNIDIYIASSLGSRSGSQRWRATLGKHPIKRSPTNARFREIQAVGEYMSQETQAKYKYQIDIGGIGGTTWTGTMAKLACQAYKFDWAESHTKQAKKIADEATEFMRHLGTPEGFGQMFEEDFVQPLQRVIEAYQPISTVDPGKTLKDVLESPSHKGGGN